MNKRSFVTICAILAVAVLVGAAVMTIPPEASASDSAMLRKVEALGAADAVPADPADYEFVDDDCILYISDAHQKGYLFNGDTELLEEVCDYALLTMDHEIPEGWVDPAPVGGPGTPERHEALLEYAAACLSPNQIGELELESSNTETGAMQIYRVKEYYDGVPTGTSVEINCQNGSIFWARVNPGTVFRTEGNGAVALAQDAQPISPEEATAAALACFGDSEQVLTDQVTCEMNAYADILAYDVRVPYLTENSWQSSYVYVVDAYTGEILETIAFNG